MVHRRVRAIVISLGSVACASLALACSQDNGNSPVPDAGVDDAAPLDSGAVLDAPMAPDSTLEAGTETPDAATPVAEAATPPMDAPAESAAPVDAADSSIVEEAEASVTPDASLDAPDANFHSLRALSFDGVSNWVHLPAAPGGASEVAFTEELWFRSKSGTGNMFEVYGSGGGADRFLSLNSGAVCFYVYASPITQVCTTATTYGDDAWHHAAGTLGAGGVKLYLDGVLAASSTATTSSSFTTDTDFRLGMGHVSFDSSIVYFQGDLDEVRVWSVERSAADIAANYMQTIDPTTAGLQGYWPLEETGSSSVAHDVTAGNDGQLMNFTFSPSPWISPGAF
jgi:hypothetical protein